jgi:hypothetical protein
MTRKRNKKGRKKIIFLENDMDPILKTPQRKLVDLINAFSKVSR